MESPLESAFKKAVKAKLDKTPNLYYFVKEALSIRGIADIIGCYRGIFFAWELKRSQVEGTKTTGRIVLQKYNLDKVIQAGGIGEIVYPENFEETYNTLIATGNSRER